MKNILKSILITVGLITLAGCTDNFVSLNVNPNGSRPDAADPKFQFLYSVSRSNLYANQWQVGDQATVCHFIEYAANDPLSASDYSMDARYIQGIWDLTYIALANFNAIIRSYEDDPLHVNVVNMSKIWKCWLMLRLTDYLGDIPYSEAGNIEATNHPVYDLQKDIYYGMFEELANVQSKFDANADKLGSYDLIYGGDLDKWKKFANSLRLRMALRIAKVDNTKAKTEAAAAIAAGVMTSREDDALIGMGSTSAETSSQNPVYYHRNSSVIHMSTAYYRIVENLGGIDWPNLSDQNENPNITNHILNAEIHPAKVDPRAFIHFEPSGIIENVTTDTLNHNWAGTNSGNVTSAVGAGMATGQHVNDYAKIGEWFYKYPDRGVPVLEYSEVCFLQAIAIETGILTSANAENFYEAGITANMQKFGIPAAKITAYLNSEDTNYYGTTVKYSHIAGTANTTMDKIITQKWISHFVEGSFEAWADHRLYHKPTLMPFEHVSSSVFTMNPDDKANNTPNAYIKRGYYPSTEQVQNAENYSAAVARMGSNSIQNNVWWDVD
ncbi:MAG: SusD/RagB family nutrient-binding outer membrane lipoprotein [Prevotellaceae bacterium]|jgi:hypothetical protein|nr:SusD/RagB family nutrient-binding outer membrane lipoprotein [Prevotellaceae bacterium]